MSMRRLGTRATALVGLAVLVLVAFLTMVSSASATEKLSEGEIKLLKSILPHITYMGSGVGGKPTIRFSGVNVQVVSGAGKTNAAVNGEGNLVIGYDENRGKPAQTGSHDLILGEEQTFTSFGAILGGSKNTASGAHSFVVGEFNVASGQAASVSGGSGNKAEAQGDSVSGGTQNVANGFDASVSGGENNRALELYASVSGGAGNEARYVNTSISGGEDNVAENIGDSVSGGRHNLADGGGHDCGEPPGGASVSGGENNRASQVGSSVSGGVGNEANGELSWIGGGYKNKTTGTCGPPAFATVFGGKELTASNEYEAIP